MSSVRQVWNGSGQVSPYDNTRRLDLALMPDQLNPDSAVDADKSTAQTAADKEADTSTNTGMALTAPYVEARTACRRETRGCGHSWGADYPCQAQRGLGGIQFPLGPSSPDGLRRVRLRLGYHRLHHFHRRGILGAIGFTILVWFLAVSCGEGRLGGLVPCLACDFPPVALPISIFMFAGYALFLAEMFRRATRYSRTE